ncbi:uncharacterized protein LOC116604396 [Nematostella vectensis]|uniref:uncharacterized protein LOC116604396 n=1 Tax=Nematostella vectensis TaxID=45351 RepID=UPI00207707BD|nr:uncharacterized protein LOC116604396 [Nematostella vectensis]
MNDKDPEIDMATPNADETMDDFADDGAPERARNTPKNQKSDDYKKAISVKAAEHPDDAPAITKTSPERDLRSDDSPSFLTLDRRGWSGWSIWSVPKESEFPDYDQFTQDGVRCLVGCGPVAWAMVFGYYDRLAATSSSYGYSSRLYRCNGADGSPSCIPPKSNNDILRRYSRTSIKRPSIERSPSIQRSFTNVPNFPRYVYCKLDLNWYQARQGGGASISKYTTSLSVAGWVQTWIRNEARDAIKQGYPAIVGIWIKGAQHYAVAFKYKTRTRVGNWVTERQEMGWDAHGMGRVRKRMVQNPWYMDL